MTLLLYAFSRSWQVNTVICWRHLINIYSFRFGSSLFGFESKNYFSRRRQFCKPHRAVILKGSNRLQPWSSHACPAPPAPPAPLTPPHPPPTPTPAPRSIIPISRTRKPHTGFLWVQIAEDCDSHWLRQNNDYYCESTYSRKHLPGRTKGANNFTP